MAKLTIKSDGTGQGTRAYYDDIELKGIESISFSKLAFDTELKATLTFCRAHLELEMKNPDMELNKNALTALFGAKNNESN